MDVIQVGNLTETERNNPNRRRVYNPCGLCPTLTAGMGMGGNLQPFVVVENRDEGSESDRECHADINQRQSKPGKGL